METSFGTSLILISSEENLMNKKLFKKTNELFWYADKIKEKN